MRGANRTSALICVGLATAVGVLAGCSGGTDEASPSPEHSITTVTKTTVPTTTTTTETSTTTSPTLRPVPPEAMELSEAGALAFLTWWLEAYNFAEATGEIDAISSSSEPTCSFCESFAARVGSVYKGGGSIQGEGPVVLDRPQVKPIDPSNYTIVEAGLNSPASVVYDRNGTPIEEFSASGKPVPVIVGLQWSNTAWLVTEVEKVAQP